MHAITKEWIEKAEHDYITAGLVIDHKEPLADVACFHSQQSAEKYLKAYLQENQVDFPYRHPLLPLLELCISIDEAFELLRDDLRRLDAYAIAVRYPGIYISVDIANSALDSATKIRSFVRKHLGLPENY